MRRLLTAAALVTALVTALVLGLLAWPVTAATSAPPPSGAKPHAAPHVSVTPLWFSVVVGADNDTRCTIVADLYTPSSATPRHRVPAILTTNGFGGSKDDQAGEGRYFASKGYVVLSYSGLGFGGSSCPISLDDPDHDGKAARFLVSYLGGQRGHAYLDAGLSRLAPRLKVVRHDRRDHAGHRTFHDPKVGMLGGSYGGGVQFAAASVDPRIDTLVPLITWNDLSYSLAPNNTGQSRIGIAVTSAVTGAAKLLWAAGFSALGAVDGTQNAQADQDRLLPCPDFQSWVCPALVHAVATGTLDADTATKLHDRSVAAFMGRIRVPVLLAQGEGDTLFNLNEAIANYRALRHQGTPVKMIWSLGGHSQPYPKGEIDTSAPNARTQYLTHRFLHWFDHYLKGRKHSSTGPRFAYYRDWVPYSGDAAPAYATAPSYPLAGSRVLYLSGSSLVLDASEITAGTSTFTTPPGGLPTSYDPADVVGSYLALDDQDLPGTYAAWTTAPLSAPLTVVGSPVLQVQVDAPTYVATGSDETALTLFVKVMDVDAGGKASLIRGLVAPVRVADPTQPFTVRLPAIAHQFAPGHSLRLEIAGGSVNYRGGAVPTPVSVTTGSSGQALLLPLG